MMLIFTILACASAARGAVAYAQHDDLVGDFCAAVCVISSFGAFLL